MDLRPTGIEVIGDAPWGTHCCQFYGSKEDLVDILVPYFKAGLENDELCMWVTSPPLGVREAWEALGRAVPDLDAYRKRGRIEILPHTEWYLLGGVFDQDRVLRGWVEKLEAALSRGCAGMRLSGDTFWLETSDWRTFTEYEAAVEAMIGQYRMLAFCTYAQQRCGVGEVADVITNHEFALVKREGSWQRIASHNRRRMQESHAREREHDAEALRDQKEWFRVTLSSIGDAVLVTDPQGRVTFVNAVAEQLTGWTQGSALGRALDEVFQVVNEETGTRIEDPAARVIESGTVQGLANHTVLVTREGARRPIDDSAAPIRDAQGRLLGVVLVFRDITARRLADNQTRSLLAAVQEEKDRLAALVASITDEIWFADLQKRFTLANPSAVREFALGRDSGMDVERFAASLEVFRPDGSPRPVEEAPPLRALKGEVVRNQEEIVRTPASGELRHRQVSAAPVRDATGTTIGSVSVVRDITDLKRTEEKLTRHQALLRGVLDSSLSGIMAFTAVRDSNGAITDFAWALVNLAAERMVGISASDLLGRRLLEVMPGNKEEGLFEMYVAVVETGAPLHHEHYYAHEKVKTWFETVAVKQGDGFVVTFSDITERKRAEEALRESEATLRGILNAAKESIWLFTTDGVTLLGNETALARWGKPPETIIGRPIQEALPEDLARPRLARLQEAARSGPIEFEDCRAGIMFEHRFYPVHGADGRVDRIAAFSRDITERKRVEGALRESEGRFRTVMEHSLDCIYQLNLQAGHYEYVSPAVEKVLGVSAQQLMSRSTETVHAMIHPADRPALQAALARLEEVGEGEAEYRMQTAKGDYRWISNHMSLTKDGVGQPLFRHGIIRDVTERKRAEEALRVSEQQARDRAAELDAIFNTVLSPLIVFDAKGQVVKVNEASRRLFGADPTGLDGEAWPQFVIQRHGARHHEGRPLEAADLPVRLALQGDKVRGIGLVVRDTARHDVFIDAASSPMWADGRVIGAVTVWHDITDRVRVERLYAVLSQVNEAIVRTHDEETLYQEVCRILAEEGRFPLAWVGLVSGREVAPAAARGTAVAYLSDVTVEIDGELGRGPTGTSIREDRTVVNEDFASNPAAAPWREPARRHGFGASAAFPIRRQGAVIGALTLYAAAPGAFDAAHVRLLEALCADLSYAVGAMEQERWRSHAEQVLRENEQSLREADRRKDEFLALLAHELRNPLAPILNSVQIIRRAAEKTGLRERAEAIIEKQVRHMARLIDDLLDVSRIGQGKIVLKRELLPLATVVENAVETSQPVIDGAGHELNVRLPTEPVLLLGDRVRLSQVLSNILNNAARYSLQRGAIHLTASVEEAMVGIRVRDEGIGIDPETLPRIFDLFVQGDSSLERQRGGLGVGLALCKSLVDMHGGTITATSAGPGRGSEFVVRLPLAPASRAAGTDSPAAAPGARPTARFRVLVVDDSADVAESMSVLLELLGHDVQSAGDGLTALDLAESFRPDIVLLDIGMPRMNGYEVARRLRQTSAGQRAVLIAMTGWGQEEDRRRTKDAGFDHHLTKPVELDHLEQLVQQLVTERVDVRRQ
jgi:PAS domain S-box-containing protein